MEDKIFNELYKSASIRKEVREISYSQFVAILNLKEKVVLVDVLSLKSFNKGHIEGSISLPVNKIEKEENLESIIPKNSKVIVYCASFLCGASTRAARILAKYGYNVLDFKGGLLEWRKKGNTLVRMVNGEW